MNVCTTSGYQVAPLTAWHRRCKYIIGGRKMNAVGVDWLFGPPEGHEKSENPNVTLTMMMLPPFGILWVSQASAARLI
jgi:hypothetical protein